MTIIIIFIQGIVALELMQLEMTIMKMYAAESENNVKYPFKHCFSSSGWDLNVGLGEIKIGPPNSSAEFAVYTKLPKTFNGLLYKRSRDSQSVARRSLNKLTNFFTCMHSQPATASGSQEKYPQQHGSCLKAVKEPLPLNVAHNSVAF